MSRIYEFRWNANFIPYFRLLKKDSLEEKPLLFGETLSLKVQEGRRCTGYEKSGEWHPCVQKTEGVKKCEDCKHKEGMSAIQYCDGFNTSLFGADELEALSKPHYLYFALFDRNLIKVGVSTTSRGFLRQIEQGAHFTLVIAEGMWGVPARQMETMISRSGMVDKIQGSQKKDIIFPDLSPEEGESILQKLAQEKLPLVTAYRNDFQQFISEYPKFYSWDKEYHLSEARTVTKPLQDISLKVGESLSGKLIAAKGPFLILETEREKILIDAKNLKGCEVNFSERPIGLEKESGFQGAMF